MVVVVDADVVEAGGAVVAADVECWTVVGVSPVSDVVGMTLTPDLALSLPQAASNIKPAMNALVVFRNLQLR